MRSPAPGGQRTTGQGKLGQTSIGGDPAPVVAPGAKPPVQVAQAGGQAGSAKLRCFSPNPDEALVCPEDRAKSKSPTGTGGSSGGGSGDDGRSGTAGRPQTPGTGTSGPGAPPGNRPPGTTPPGLPGQPPGGGKIDDRIWWEGAVLCELTSPQAQFNNWRCTGPLQMNYVNFEKANWMSALLMACGSKQPARDLGITGPYKAFGCGFPIEPGATPSTSTCRRSSAASMSRAASAIAARQDVAVVRRVNGQTSYHRHLK